MILEYHPETDMLYIRFADGVSAESQEVSPGVVLDFDANNHTIGIEIEDASKLIDLTRLELTALPIVNLAINERTPART